VQRIWTNVKRCKAEGSQVDTKSKGTLNCGRKRVHIDLEQVKTIPLNKRTTIRSLASELLAKQNCIRYSKKASFAVTQAV
jgi:hypothetical protein